MTSLLFVGKYPPVQGGTSNHLFWLAQRLDAAGLGVTVIDVPDAYAPHQQCRIEPADHELLTRVLGHRSGVRLSQPPSDLQTAYSIPRHEPLVTRLVNAALTEIERTWPLAVVGSYLEPYGMAAATAAGMTGLPYGIIHAGSDLWRLAGSPMRQRAYRGVLEGADVVASSTTGARLAVERGARPETVIDAKPILVPKTTFTPEGPRLGPVRPAATDPAEVVIGMVGKLGPAKGTDDALAAVEIARSRGTPLRLAVLTGTGGPGFEWFSGRVRARRLDDAVTVVPFIAPWRVAEFYRACDAVAFLERDFPVRIHHPQIPREVATAARPLILSHEIAATQGFTSADVHPDAVRIIDPKDHQALAAIMMTMPAGLEADHLGAANAELYRWPSERSLGSWVDAFIGELTDASVTRSVGTMALRQFQDATMRVLSDRRFREAVRADPSKVKGLQADEAGALQALLADESLDRYAQSLLNKKRRFLTRRFRPLFQKFPELEEHVVEAFTDWTLQDRDVHEEFVAFHDLCVHAGRVALDAEQQDWFADWARFALVHALVGETWPDEQDFADQPSDADTLRLNPTLKTLELNHRLIADERSPQLWRAAVWKDADDEVRMIETDGMLHGLLSSLSTVPMPRSDLDELVARSAGGVPIDVDEVVGTLLDHDLVRRATAPRTDRRT